MRQIIIRFYFLVLTSFLIWSCTARTGQNPEKPPPAPSIIAAYESAGKNWQLKWDETLKAAKKEGVVVMLNSAGAETREAMAPPFAKKYGIQLDYIAARGPEMSQKLLTERKAGLYTVDIYMGGANTPTVTLKPAGVFDPLEQAFLIPEMTDPDIVKKVWYQGKLWWLDKDRNILAITMSPSGRIAINLNQVKPDEIKTWRSLLEPRWKGKISMNDPTIEGPGNNWFSGMVNIMGLDYLRALANQEPVVVRDQRIQVDWLALGKYPITIQPNSDAVTSAINAGVSLTEITPEEGAFMTSSQGNIALVNRAPHPNAVRIFINWLLSLEGQTQLVAAQRTHSLRIDVPVDQVEPSRLRMPGKKYFSVVSEEMLLQTPKFREQAKEIFGPLIR